MKKFLKWLACVVIAFISSIVLIATAVGVIALASFVCQKFGVIGVLMLFSIAIGTMIYC